MIDPDELTPADYEIARKAVEDQLVELRDARISMLRRNGMVICEADGTPSSVIRLGAEDVVRIGLAAIAAARSTS